MSSATKIRRPSGSKTNVSAKTSESKLPGTKGSKTKVSKVKDPSEPRQFSLPAFSIPYVPNLTETELDKLRKKTIRRNAPPGEDLKGIKEILRTIRGQKISVQEFIGLIGPSTGDNGETLRVVMNEDLEAFRKLARKVYETITQDNSEVLLNQQLQLSDYYKEKKTLLNAKMMKMIEEIYMMIPKFDFDLYAKDKEDYLDKMLPLPDELKVEPEELEMMKRQAAYHRLQWLRSEGERLNEENNSLKKRLRQMRLQHVEEQKKMSEIERQAERKKEQLEAAQAEKKETLDILNQSLEKTIIEKEITLRKTADAERFSIDPKQGAVRKKGMKKKVKRPKWNEEAAVEIETQALDESRQGEKKKFEKTIRERSPFHYSPPKISPTGAQYVSPPQGGGASQCQAECSRGRRVQGPQDTWRGFN